MQEETISVIQQFVCQMKHLLKVSPHSDVLDDSIGLSDQTGNYGKVGEQFIYIYSSNSIQFEFQYKL